MPTNKLHIILLALVFLGIVTILQAEIRAIWVLPWSTNTPEKIDTFLADAVAAHQTDVFIEVRYRSDALYQTNRCADTFCNPEPRSYILNGASFDPLDYALTEGHKKNLRIHAWFVVFNATSQDAARISANYIYRNHPDWITYDRNHRRQSSSDQFRYFIDPGVPEVQDYLLNVIGDLISGYPGLDGLHLDYIRYPDTSLGYHPVSLARYAQEKQTKCISWNQWRIEQVTSFVEKTRALVDSLAPGMTLSAAVIASYHDAVDYYAQEWLDWLQRGIVDYVYPMAYQEKYSQFERTLSVIKDMHQNEHIVVGIKAWNDSGRSMMPSYATQNYDVWDVIKRIRKISSDGFAGVSLFSYDGLQKDGALEFVSRIGYPEALTTELPPAQTVHIEPENVAAAADIKVSSADKVYEFALKVPTEGKWYLELRDFQNRLLYNRDRYYLRGDNQDFWNGVLNDGTQVLEGKYLISVYQTEDKYEYVIPVNLPELQK